MCLCSRGEGGVQINWDMKAKIAQTRKCKRMEKHIIQILSNGEQFLRPVFV